MKNRMIVTAVILSFLIVAIKANADMKITPNGITSPNDSGEVHLNGRPFYSMGGPRAAVISAVNSYSGLSPSYGGYFLVYGGIGTSVYGNAENTGDVTNYGGYFRADGTTGRGVYGNATNTGDVTNYGGYFEADGTTGRGVSGFASGTSGTGVYGYAGNIGAVTHYGGYFKAGGIGGRGVYGYGGKYDFYAGGSGNYGPFTGAHEVKFAEDMPEEIEQGMIVSVPGKTEARKDEDGEISLSSTLPTVTISSRARDKAVFGVIVSGGPLPEDHWHESQEGERFGVVNALGEGRVWVTDFNGQVQAGDYITTSFVQGYGQLQDDDLLHSYTLGKAIETIDWEQVTETVQHDGRTYKRYLIAVVYTSG